GPHSAFLMVAMGSGIPALVFLLWTLVSATRALVQRASRVGDRHSYAMMLASAIMIVGFATRNIFDYMFAGSLAYLFWMLLATGLAEGRKQADIAGGRSAPAEEALEVGHAGG
ncbi:MAG: hypothetical protein ACREJU_05300, partial [Nitrospiraceae bacterium]